MSLGCELVEERSVKLRRFRRSDFSGFTDWHKLSTVNGVNSGRGGREEDGWGMVRIGKFGTVFVESTTASSSKFDSMTSGTSMTAVTILTIVGD